MRQGEFDSFQTEQVILIFFFFSGRNNTAASFFLFDKRYCFGITCNLVHRVSRWRQLRCEVLHRSVAERQNQNNTSRVRQSCDTLALHNLGSFACCHLRWLPYHGHAFADFDASGEVQKSPVAASEAQTAEPALTPPPPLLFLALIFSESGRAYSARWLGQGAKS